MYVAVAAQASASSVTVDTQDLPVDSLTKAQLDLLGANGAGASGLYAFDPRTRTMTLDLDRSAFLCEGPVAGQTEVTVSELG